MGQRKKYRGPTPGQLITSRDGALETYVDFQFGHRGKDKKPRILIGSLTLTSINILPYGSHCSNFYQMGRDIPEYDFSFVSPRRMAIDVMRNFCVELAIKAGFKYLYFFDDDTVNDVNVIGKLLPRMKEFNAICPSYYIRGYPFNPMIFIWHDKKKWAMKLCPLDIEKQVDKDKILRKNVAGIGCGCTLFRVEDFERVPYPWFKTGYGNTEDAFFFTKAHQAIPDYKVGVDFNIACGHMLDPLFVDAKNVHALRKCYKVLNKVGGVFQ